MAAEHTRQVALTAPLIAHIETQVAKGEHTSASAFVRAALHLLIEQDDSKPPPVSVSPEVVRDRACA